MINLTSVIEYNSSEMMRIVNEGSTGCVENLCFFSYSYDIIGITLMNTIVSIILFFLFDRIVTEKPKGILAGFKFEQLTTYQQKIWIIERIITLIFLVNLIALMMNVFNAWGLTDIMIEV